MIIGEWGFGEVKLPFLPSLSLLFQSSSDVTVCHSALFPLPNCRVTTLGTPFGLVPSLGAHPTMTEIHILSYQAPDIVNSL
jgi:hypothetical protein